MVRVTAQVIDIHATDDSVPLPGEPHVPTVAHAFHVGAEIVLQVRLGRRERPPVVG